LLRRWPVARAGPLEGGTNPPEQSIYEVEQHEIRPSRGKLRQQLPRSLNEEWLVSSLHEQAVEYETGGFVVLNDRNALHTLSLLLTIRCTHLTTLYELVAYEISCERANQTSSQTRPAIILLLETDSLRMQHAVLCDQVEWPCHPESSTTSYRVR
jgi:hypothetical protein